MPWWSWIVIWAALGLALVAVLVVSAIRLFRKSVGVLRALEELSAKTQILDSAADDLEHQRFAIAILQKKFDVQERHRISAEASSDRRAARFSRRVARAIEITSLDANTRTWFRRPDDTGKRSDA